MLVHNEYASSICSLPKCFVLVHTYHACTHTRVCASLFVCVHTHPTHITQVFLREAAAEAPTEEVLKLISLMRHALARHFGAAPEDDAQESPLKHKTKPRGGSSQEQESGGDIVEGLVLCLAALAQSLQQRIEVCVCCVCLYMYMCTLTHAHMHSYAQGLMQVPEHREEAVELRKGLAEVLPANFEGLECLAGSGASVPVSLQTRCAVWRYICIFPKVLYIVALHSIMLGH